MNYLTIGSITLSSTDRARIVDAWERADACADRGEDCGVAAWVTYDQLEVRVDVDGDIWHDGLLLANRRGDTAVVVGSGVVVNMY